MAKQTRTEAILALCYEAASDRGSVTGYKRALRAMRTLGLDALPVLQYLCYRTSDGSLPGWLASNPAVQQRPPAGTKSAEHWGGD